LPAHNFYAIVKLFNFDFGVSSWLVDDFVDGMHFSVEVLNESLHHIALEVNAFEKAKNEKPGENLDQLNGLILRQLSFDVFA
jgi:hypothetical protein